MPNPATEPKPRAVPAWLLESAKEYLGPVAVRLREQAKYESRHGFQADANRYEADALLIENHLAALDKCPEVE